ncbi:hypothetical protein V6R21_15465 [Limibacter armeniacum]|uniref:hypothetical protein n=1 Tax=Limibacter armeniacum TaxID=466084 RepID=UPI002FE62862
MMERETLNQEINRVINITNWGEAKLASTTCSILFLEYYRRMFLYKKEFGVITKFCMANIPKQFAILSDEESKFIGQITHNLTLSGNLKGSYLDKVFISSFLTWRLKLKEIIRGNKFIEDPYEPMILFYELGGYLGKDQGNRITICSGTAFNLEVLDKFMDTNLNTPFITDMAKENLDSIECMSFDEYLNYQGILIPNQ